MTAAVGIKTDSRRIIGDLPPALARIASEASREE
jgi:hypothetical protein